MMAWMHSAARMRKYFTIGLLQLHVNESLAPTSLQHQNGPWLAMLFLCTACESLDCWGLLPKFWGAPGWAFVPSRGAACPVGFGAVALGRPVARRPGPRSFPSGARGPVGRVGLVPRISPGIILPLCLAQVKAAQANF